LTNPFGMFGRKFLFALNNLMAVAVVTGCQAASVTAESISAPQTFPNNAPTLQLMIKFRPNTLDCSTAGIARLSSDTLLHLVYIRPMSGDACVIKLLAVDDNDIGRANELLKKHPAVEWVEPDSKKKAM